MDMNELFARALKTDPAQIGHYVQGGFMDASIKPISEDIKMIGPAFFQATITQCFTTQ